MTIDGARAGDGADASSGMDGGGDGQAGGVHKGRDGQSSHVSGDDDGRGSRGRPSDDAASGDHLRGGDGMCPARAGTPSAEPRAAICTTRGAGAVG